METTGVIFLDSCFVIEVLRKNAEAHAKLSLLRKTSDVRISTIALGELYYGAFRAKRVGEPNMLKLVLQFFKKEPFDEATAELCGKLLADLEKQGKVIEFRDAAIAATALRYGGNILTYDKKHFERIPGITII